MTVGVIKKNFVVVFCFFSLCTVSAKSSESLREMIGEPSLETTDSVLAAVRCGGLMLALVSKYTNSKNTPKKNIPEKLFTMAEFVLPWVQVHLRITKSIRENKRIFQEAVFYRDPANSHLQRPDFVFCGTWAYMNVQKYGLPR